MNLQMNNLIKCFIGAIENGANYIGVKVKHEDSEGAEIIINPSENFKDKLEYYKNAYNEDLVLKNCNKIRIIGFTYGDSFESIQDDLM